MSRWFPRKSPTDTISSSKKKWYINHNHRTEYRYILQNEFIHREDISIEALQCFSEILFIVSHKKASKAFHMCGYPF